VLVAPFLVDPAEQVAVELERGRCVLRPRERAVEAIGVALDATIAMRHLDNAPGGVVAVCGRRARRPQYQADPSRLIPLVPAPQSVEPMLFGDVARRVEHEAIDGAVLVLDGGELFFGVVVKLDARARFDARGEA
jgi:hypothetical protein